ncbi:ATP-binding cassette domain-containing protein [Streptomyces sp. NPDC002018]|uniref:ATP-binding cassette domain-containing protein n=1 Tax=Streptomyces sp. NPDC002018 TaxID=3364629 RepID=UPI0036B84CF0
MDRMEADRDHGSGGGNSGETGGGSSGSDDDARGAGDEPRGAAVVAEDFGLKGPRGWVFRQVRVDAAPGTLVAVQGPSGSGRTCLLLALTGRMRPTEGHAETGGLPLPRAMAAVRRISALAHVPGLSELDPALTVAEHLRERVLLRRRFDGSPRALLRSRADRAAEARDRIATALMCAGLDTAALPKGDRTSARDLERLEALRLQVALALIGRPRLLAVDDLDLKLSGTERAEAWRLLRSVAGSGTTVLAVCGQAPGDADTVVRTDAGPDESREGSREGSPDESPDRSQALTPDDRRDRQVRHDRRDRREDDNDHKPEEETADALAETGRA